MVSSCNPKTPTEMDEKNTPRPSNIKRKQSQSHLQQLPNLEKNGTQKHQTSTPRPSKRLRLAKGSLKTSKRHPKDLPKGTPETPPEHQMNTKGAQRHPKDHPKDTLNCLKTLAITMLLEGPKGTP